MARKIIEKFIDAGALVNKLGPEYKSTVKLINSGEEHLDNLAEGYKEVYDLIIAAPAVEVEFIRHGHWEVAIGYDPRRQFQCSECTRMAFEASSYCPNCGAKMDRIE